MMPCGPVPTVTVEVLAADCVSGDRLAGMELVQRLWAHGVPDDEHLITGLVALAAPATLRLDEAQFDRLADAIWAARQLRDETTL